MGCHSPPALTRCRWRDHVTQLDTEKCHYGHRRSNIPKAGGPRAECHNPESRGVASTNHRPHRTTCAGGEPTIVVNRDESQDCVGGQLEQGLLQSYETSPFCIFFIIFSLTQGFLGGSKPLKHCKWVKGRPRVRKPWFVDHWMHRLK